MIFLSRNCFIEGRVRPPTRPFVVPVFNLGLILAIFFYSTVGKSGVNDVEPQQLETLPPALKKRKFSSNQSSPQPKNQRKKTSCSGALRKIEALKDITNKALSHFNALSPCCKSVMRSYVTQSTPLESGSLLMPVEHVEGEKTYHIVMGQSELIKNGEFSIQSFPEKFLPESRVNAEKALCDSLVSLSFPLGNQNKCEEFKQHFDYLSSGRTSTVYVVYDQEKIPFADIPKPALIKMLRSNGFTDLSNLQAAYNSYWQVMHGTYVVKALKLNDKELSDGIRRDYILDYGLEQIANHVQLSKDGKSYPIVRIAKSEPLTSLDKGIIIQEAVHGVSLAELHEFLASNQPTPSPALKRVGIENLADAKTYFQAITYFYDRADQILSPYAEENGVKPIIEDRFNSDETKKIDVKVIIDQNRGYNAILTKSKVTGQPEWVLVDR